MKDYEKKIIEFSDERKEFVTDVDGFVYFWPQGTKGHFASHHLRAIADELDRRNEEWNKNIDEYFKNQEQTQQSIDE